MKDYCIKGFLRNSLFALSRLDDVLPTRVSLDLQLHSNEQHSHDDDNNGDNNNNANNNNGNNNKDNDMGILAFPLARIHKICRLDPEVKGISKGAAILVTRAAELFTARLGQDTFQMAQKQNRGRRSWEVTVTLIHDIIFGQQ